MKYLILIERTETGFSAWSPDVPGCVATGRTEQQVATNMPDAMAFHSDGLRETSEQVPSPATRSRYVEVAA